MWPQIVFLGVFVLTVCGGKATPPEAPCEGADDESKMSVHDNAMFNARHDGGDPPPCDVTMTQQQPKISLGQTLRFMSKWGGGGTPLGLAASTTWGPSPDPSDPSDGPRRTTA